MFKGLIEKFSEVLTSLNKTSIQRIIIYTIIVYPAIVLFTYKDEIRLLISTQKRVVEIENVANAQERCFNLRKSYNAEAVIVYLYQPNHKLKTYKERIVFSASNNFKPLEQTKKVNLASQSRLLEEMRTSNVAVITRDSQHQNSSMILAYQLDKIVVTPIHDVVNGQIIGEVMWVFKEIVDVDYNTLYQEGQVFTYNIT